MKEEKTIDQYIAQTVQECIEDTLGQKIHDLLEAYKQVSEDIQVLSEHLLDMEQDLVNLGVIPVNESEDGSNIQLRQCTKCKKSFDLNPGETYTTCTTCYTGDFPQE